PFDNPVSAANLTGNFAVDVDYQTTFYSGSTTLAASETANLGTLTVNADTALQLGRSSNRLPRRATIGQSTAHSLNGSGLSSGSTLTVSDPDLTVSSVSWFGSVVSFTVTVPPGESPGHVDVIVENASGDVDRLVAGIELAPPDPVVSSVAPTIASPDGGTSLTISGSNFRAGARVVIGDRVYEDGDANGTTVVDAATITLTTAATVDGTHDVVVIDETGVEGRAADGLMVTEVPALATVFPVAGEVGGGTTVRLLGDDFVDGAQVFFGGVLAASVMVVDETRIDAVTPSSPGTGSVSVQVVNPGGLSSASSFTYTLTADPTLASLTPATGATAGGDTITLSGSDFDGDTQVRFGVDPLDGTGGTAAASVTLIDAATLEVVTPAGSGSVAVMVTDGGTGQADVLEAGFTYSSSDGGGGGGCGSIATPGPGTWRDAIGNAGWAALLLLFALVHRARSLRRTAPLAS
ncbi:MAG: IPT/TIG domain-containing protein, partial [Planctomycetota bacterium]